MEAKTIISFYDSDFDGILSFVEFLNMILSDSDFSKRRIVKDGKNSSRAKYGLNHDIEFSLVLLLEKELDLARAIDLLLNEIKCRFDYNIFDIYSAIQGYGDYITNEG